MKSIHIISGSVLLRILTGLAIVLLACVEVAAQRYVVRNFSAKEGLSQSEVGDIVQDYTGRLFITTASSGVDVFDGVSFNHLDVKDGLISPYIGEVFKDSKGQIWFASTKGLNLYRKDSIQSYVLDKEFYGLESIFGMEELSPDHFLLATDHGVVEFIQGEFKVHRSELFPSLRYFDVILCKNGQILFATDEGLFEMKDGEIIRSDIGSGFPDHTLLAILEMKNGELLLGSKNGLYYVKNTQVEFVPLLKDDAYSVISLLESSNGTLYAGTNGKGLYFKSPGDKNFTRIHEGNGLSDDYTWTLYEDMDENIWIGTSGAGLDLLSAEHFQIYNPAGGLRNDIVYDILQRANGEMWFGIVQGGISVFNGTDYKFYGVKDGLSHLSVRCFLDEGDTLWIGTESGLTIYTDGRFQDVSDRYQIAQYAIFDIHRDAHGALWFACKGERYYGENGGVVRFKNGRLDYFTKKNGLSSDNVYCILEEDNGNLLFGSTGGIDRWDGAQISPIDYPAQNSACHGTTLTLRKDSRGSLWAGTVGGLAVWQKGTFRCLRDKPGLTGNTIYFLETQGDSILWVGSASGLEKLDLDYFYEQDSLKTTLYNDFNGFFGTECNQNAVTVDAQGNYWFGTIGGAVKYMPSKDHVNPKIPQIEIVRVNKKGKETDWRVQGFDIGKDGLPIHAELAHNENSVQIEFIGIALKDPTAMAYSFILLGADQVWSDFQKERSVFYSNLAPGSYIFQVKSKDVNTGLMSKPVSFTFSIIPAFYQTVWFKVLLVVLLILGLITFFFWRMRSIRLHAAEQRDFQHKLAELEMTALRSQMNPHFLFNSLNSVNGFIIKNNREEASAYLTKFSRLVRMVLQNSQEKHVSLEDELTALHLYIEMESLRFKDGFHFIEKISPSVDLNSHRIPPLLLQPYVENAIWHGLLHLNERQGILTLSIHPKANGILISIEDNGIGREKSEMMKSKSAMKRKSMGMQINADRMNLSKELYAFSINVEIKDLKSREGRSEGTRVNINIKEHEA